MKRLSILLWLILTTVLSLQAADTVFVRETRIPILLERQDNVLFYLRVDAKESRVLDEVVLELGKNVDCSEIQAVKLYYGGTEALQDKNKGQFAPVEYISSNTPGKTLAANLSYSIRKAQINTPNRRTLVLKGKQNLFPGINYFWISLQMKPDASLYAKVSAQVISISLDGKKAPLQVVSDKGIEHRMAVGVRHAGDDGSAAFRIPGLVTTNKGTLLGVYDVRYNSSVDLQEHVDIGLSRSTDGGKTWEKMRLPLSFGETGGLPAAQNGVGDPSILVDTKTNTVWIVAAWTHGMGNKRAWFSSHPGMDMNHTAQLVLAKSEDDGQTWSAPINITEQVKDPSWYFLLQGPGRGITMDDGTLVFPTQYIGADRVPNAGIMYSTDRGKTWQMHHYARTNTTEAQVAEIEPGVLMLNMRDNRGGSRAVAITRDLGRTWTEHSSSRKALQEPVCMASLISVKAKDNASKKDILLFSNPNTVKGRRNITIKASLDGGITWLPEHQLLLDEGDGWGYSCLTMIDAETVGILYESSVAHMTFQAVKLEELGLSPALSVGEGAKLVRSQNAK
ncbi:BNR-repeat neuraminidase N-terminal domain-containing protein [Bacteroides sp.]